MAQGGDFTVRSPTSPVIQIVAEDFSASAPQLTSDDFCIFFIPQRGNGTGGKSVFGAKCTLSLPSRFVFCFCNVAQDN